METKWGDTFCFRNSGFLGEPDSNIYRCILHTLMLVDVSIVNTDVSIFMIVYHTFWHPVEVTIVCFPRNFNLSRNFQECFTSQRKSTVTNTPVSSEWINICVLYNRPGCSDIIILQPLIIPFIREQHKTIWLNQETM